MVLCYCWRGYQWKETDDDEDGGGGGADAANSDADDADADDVGDGDVDRVNGGNDVDNNDSYHVVKYIMMGWWWD